MEVSLHKFVLVELHVIAKIIKAEFVVGSICDIAIVGLFPFRIVHAMDNHANGKAQKLIDPPHPFGVPPGEIVIHSNKVCTLARQSIQIKRKGCGQGLSFTRFHLSDFSPMEHNTAYQLNVKMPHSQHPHRGLSYGGKCLREKFIQGLPSGHSFLELGCFFLKLPIGKGLKLRFQPVDLINQRGHSLKLPFVLTTKNAFYDFPYHDFLPNY